MGEARKVSQTQPPTTLVVCLLLLAVLMAMLGTALGLVTLYVAGRDDQIALRDGFFVMGCFAVGWSAGAVLWAAAWLVRRQYGASITEQRIVSLLGETPGPWPDGEPGPLQAGSAAPRSMDAELGQQILAELTELNANMLLSDAQREAKARQRQSALLGQLLEQTDRAIEKGDFVGAEKALQRLVSAVPDAPQHAELQQRLKQARAAAAAEELRRETRRAEDLMAVGSFGQARKVAEQLAGRHPGEADARALLEKVRREAAAFHVEQRRRLYGEVERCAEARQWRQALEAAGKLLAAYPKSPESDLVAAQMPTLKDNARIEEVREMKDHIRDLVERRRFAEAAEVAEEVIRRFPRTQAANALRGQVDRLRRRAAEAGGQ